MPASPVLILSFLQKSHCNFSELFSILPSTIPNNDKQNLQPSATLKTTKTAIVKNSFYHTVYFSSWSCTSEFLWQKYLKSMQTVFLGPKAEAVRTCSSTEQSTMLNIIVGCWVRRRQLETLSVWKFMGLKCRSMDQQKTAKSLAERTEVSFTKHF